jgi:hypothetical protein
MANACDSLALQTLLVLRNGEQAELPWQQALCACLSCTRTGIAGLTSGKRQARKRASCSKVTSRRRLSC